MMYTPGELSKISGGKESPELIVHYCLKAMREGMEHLVETTPQGSRTLYKASENLLCWIELSRRQYKRAETEIQAMLVGKPEGMTVLEIAAQRGVSGIRTRYVMQKLVIEGKIKCLHRYRRKYVLITQEEPTNV